MYWLGKKHYNICKLFGSLPDFPSLYPMSIERELFGSLQIVPRFALKAIEREVMSPFIYQVWWALLHCHEHKENVFIFRTSTVKSLMLVLYNQSKKKVCQPTYPIFFYKNVTVTQAFFPWLNLKTWIFRRKMICKSFWHYSQFHIPLDYNYQ